MGGLAPYWVTIFEATLHPNSPEVSNDFPFKSSNKKPAANISPAPVESMTLSTFSASIAIFCWLFKMIAKMRNELSKTYSDLTL